MINITSNVNKKTYILPLEPSLHFYYSTRENIPKTLEYVSVPQQVKFSHFFSSKKCLTHFLTLDSSYPMLIFCFAKIYNSIINCAYSNSITIPCANSTLFYALILPNRREIDKQYLHFLASMPF